MNKCAGCVYLTINLINGKKYIGKNSTCNNNYLGSNKELQKDIQKYGFDNFRKIILECADSEQKLIQLELYYIDIFNAIENKTFYNKHRVSTGGNNFIKMSQKQQKQYLEHFHQNVLRGEQHPFYGTHRSQEVKDKISIKNKTNWENKSEEDKKQFCQKMSELSKGEKNGNYGHYWSEEKKKQLSEKLKGTRTGKNNPNYGNKDDNAKTGRRVYIYNENGQFVREFRTLKSAAKFFNYKSATPICKAIIDKRLLKGYYVSFDKMEEYK